MSELQYLIDGLSDTESALAKVSKAAEERPDDQALRVNLTSIKKRQADLVRRLDYSLRVNQNEICRYRVKRDWSEVYPAKAVAQSLSAFQDLVTAIYDALKTAPKIRYRPNAENIALSEFNFSGASVGSVVVTLAIPNDRLLAGETILDRTLDLVRKTLEAKDSEALQALAQEIGVASISKAYAWADASVSYGLDTSIDWGKSYIPSHHFVVTRADAEAVKEVIESKSAEENNILEIDCTLLGFDGATSYFHIEQIGEKADIRGTLGPSISKSWTTQGVYRARVLKTSQIRYATGEEKVSWTLLDLSPLTLPSRD